MAQFDQFFRPSLRMHGYEGVFAPKSRARTMSDWDRNFVDGCATFWKIDQFKLDEKHFLVEFNQTAMSRPSLRKHKDVYNRVMTRDNIALVTRLEHIKTRRPVLVTNCHIHWDPRYKDVKLLQTIMLVEEVERVAGQLPPSGAVILCGDFNSLPESGVCDFLANGAISSEHPDFASHTYEPYTMDGAKHSLCLRNAYALLTEETELESGATPFTNFTPNFFGIIDYIWYRPTTLSVTGLLGSISTEYIKQIVGLPTQHFPSDHVALLTEFKFEPAQASSASYHKASPPSTSAQYHASSSPPQPIPTSTAASIVMGNPLGSISINSTTAFPPLSSSPPATTDGGGGSGGRDGSEGRRLYSRNKSTQHG